MTVKPAHWSATALLLFSSACAVAPTRRIGLAPTVGPQHVGLNFQIRPDSAVQPRGDQIVAGWMGSVLGGFIAWRLFDEPNGQHAKVKSDWGYTPRALTALAIGSHVGSTLGVWGRGKVIGSSGSIVSTGAMAALPGLLILARTDDPLLMLEVVMAWGPLQSYMAYTGYRMSNRSRLGVVRPDRVIAENDEQPAQQRSSSTLITREELEKSVYTNAYDAVRQLRPHWSAAARLRSGAEREAAGEAGVIIVYLDGIRMGDTESLRQVELTEVIEIRYFDAREATNRFGTGHPAGAISVRRINGAPR